MPVNKTCDRSIRNFITNLLRRLFLEKFNSLPISNQLQKEDRDSLLCRLDKVFKSNGIVNLAVKVTDSWAACHEFKTKVVPLKSHRVGAMHIKFVEAHTSSRLNGVEAKRGRKFPAQVVSSSLDHGSELRGPSPKALE
ncbi:hypothetical protein TNCV_2301241 [Trichonephila clavipes]|nr:hypothetical protein TNCV_2301241 [Trichonephila clavipes]